MAQYLLVKLKTLLRGIFHDTNVPNRPNTESPLAAQECRLDIEALDSEAHQGTNTSSPSSSPLSVSSHPNSSPTPKIRSSSGSPPKGLLPISSRHPITPQSTDYSATTPRQEASNSITQFFQDQDLGKTVMGFLMPMTAALLSPYAPTSAIVRKLIFLSLSFGLAALWNGILLRRIFPRHAIIIEQIGATFVLLAFYGLISSYLPNYLVWIPYFCFLLVLFPFYYLARSNTV